MPIRIYKDCFGVYYDENGCVVEVSRYTLSNDSSTTVQVISYGATITSITVPDKKGIVDDIVLGFSSIQEYIDNQHYVGATIGRVANRIACGKFRLGSEEYHVTTNDPPHHLHGGCKGFDKVIWDTCIDNDKVIMKYVSPDGEEGYPGEVTCEIIFRLTEQNELAINYCASTTKDTPLSLTNHSYFNLAGHARLGSVYDHVVTINANSYTPKDETTNIPTGEIRPVSDTPFDFQEPTGLGARMFALDDGGFDHNFCLQGEGKVSVQIEHPHSERVLELFTTLPGLQVYTANCFPVDGQLKGKRCAPYVKHGAIALEPQHYPNAVNEDRFPNCVLRPGEVYKHETIYRFSVV